MSVSTATPLMTALNFTEIDLNANRAGDLSLAQAERLRKNWRRTLWVTLPLVIAVLVGASLLIYLGQRQNNGIIAIMGIALTVLNAYIVGRLAQARYRLSADLRPPLVIQDGQVERTLRIVGRGRLYVLKIDGRELLVTRPIFNAFEDKARYRLYRTPASKQILSAERL
ncbi:MAG: hypothetical protein NZM00_09180 [Anaerolinea sp.]|nr:hypothetical protein [Anaerolinea sp.]